MSEMIPKEEPSSEACDFDEVKDENTQLLLDLANLCYRQDRKDVENILLLGMSGAGKSALVNTVIKVIAGKYIPKAHVGKGTAASKTLCLTRYDSLFSLLFTCTYNKCTNVMSSLKKINPSSLKKSLKFDLMIKNST